MYPTDKIRNKCIVVLAIITGVFVFLVCDVLLRPKVQSASFSYIISRPLSESEIVIDADEQARLEKQVHMLNKKLERLTPGGAFLLINTTENTFRLIRKNEIIRQGLCSTGSLVQLHVDSTKSYTFETPTGALRVKSKITDPVWRKPDWAFIEEGLPVPPANHNSRFERGVLGDYALNLGNGYLIHGTLYQRLLGLPVTHGCIRLADEDLEAVYKNLQVGSKVFIY